MPLNKTRQQAVELICYFLGQFRVDVSANLMMGTLKLMTGTLKSVVSQLLQKLQCAAEQFLNSTQFTMQLSSILLALFEN
jgi:hypothetical protein